MKIEKGTNRTVFLIGPWAIKVARFWHSNSKYRWKSFLRGILANIDEAYWQKLSSHKELLCPVLFKSPLGVVVVMRRAESINEEEYSKDVFSHVFKAMPLDNKIENFGKIGDKIVLIDYGDSPYMCEDCDYIFKNR